MNEIIDKQEENEPIQKEKKPRKPLTDERKEQLRNQMSKGRETLALKKAEQKKIAEEKTNILVLKKAEQLRKKDKQLKQSLHLKEDDDNEEEEEEEEVIVKKLLKHIKEKPKKKKKVVVYQSESESEEEEEPVKPVKKVKELIKIEQTQTKPVLPKILFFK